MSFEVETLKTVSVFTRKPFFDIKSCVFSQQTRWFHVVPHLGNRTNAVTVSDESTWIQYVQEFILKCLLRLALNTMVYRRVESGFTRYFSIHERTVVRTFETNTFTSQTGANNPMRVVVVKFSFTVSVFPTLRVSVSNEMVWEVERLESDMLSN